MNEQYLGFIKRTLQDNFDVKFREIKLKEGIVNIVFIDNLCDSKFISQYISAPLINSKHIINGEALKKEIIEACIVDDVKSKEDAIIHILSGDAVLISNFFTGVIYCEAKGYVRRAVSIPITENVVKGPREGFTEAFVDNVSLIRRKVKNPNLKFETSIVGEKSNTTVVITYIKGVASDELIEFVKREISSLDLSFILESNYIEEKFRPKGTVFDTVGYSEKPDVVASKIFEGRIAIIVDGVPFVMTLPYFFIENFHMPDDYYYNKHIANLTRTFRWIAFFFAVFLPGLYIATTTFHFSIIPKVFVINLAIARAGVPFPTVIEVILMSFFFQILREAGIRLPQPVGQAMSIVGALILGEAAVGAGLASQGTLIIVALSSISSFLIPKLSGAITIWSFIIILFSSILGLPGFFVGFVVFISHISGLNSCKYPYVFPLGTDSNYRFKDIVLRDDLNKISKSIFSKGEENED